MSDFKFSTDIEVRISDINYGGHLGNDRYLSLFQDARLRYLQQFGYSELSVGNDTGLIMTRAHVDFKAEAFWGERLKIMVRIAELKPKKFVMEYLMVNPAKQDRLVATGYTVMLGFDYKNRKLKKFPEKFIRQIKEFEQ